MNPIEKLLEKLKEDDRLISNGEIKENLLMQLVLQNDEELIKRLLEIDDVREEYFLETKFGLTFLQDKFIKFLSGKSSWLNSYTRYRNKIGLSNNNELLKDSGKVVVDFPYKDCVLEGGQTKEEVSGDKKEVFYNKVIDKKEIDRLFDYKAFQNVKRYTKNGEEENTTWSNQDNLIIKGNNLLALHSIKARYKGLIKTIFIDPPFNTEQDSFKYNDKFNHSTWLTFMKNRLEVARDLLSDDGAIFVHIDYNEMPYLKVLMDELFDRDNFVQLISIKTASPAGFKTVNPGPIDVTEYILFYTKNRKKYKFRKMYVPTEYDDNYNLVIQNPEESAENWILKPIREVIYEQNGIDTSGSYHAQNKRAKELWGEHWKIIREQMISAYALENADIVVSKRDPHKPTKALKEKLAMSKLDEYKGKVILHEKTSNDEEDDDARYTYVYEGGALARFSNKVKEIDGVLTSTELLTDFWSDISWDGIAREGGVTLKNGKKPEKLIRRIIEMSTNEGDIVLDFFLGSGTTCAVAHKMNRRYIGIEQLDYGENDSVVRLQNVINGDQTGVSKSVNWQEGGSFLYTELMKYNQLYVEQIINASNKEELLIIFEQIKEKGFLNYRVNLEKFNINETEFTELPIENQKEILIDFLDQNQLYVNYGDIDDEQFEISDADRKFMESFYEGGE